MCKWNWFYYYIIKNIKEETIKDGITKEDTIKEQKIKDSVTKEDKTIYISDEENILIYLISYNRCLKFIED